MGKLEGTKEVRIDKWLWAVRIFKTRTMAADACKKNRVSIGGVNQKPSKMVKIGDLIQVRKPPVTFSFEVLDLSDKRMGAKLVPGFMKNVTPLEELDALNMKRTAGFVDRARGTGRPTKKERRDLEDFTEDNDLFDFDDWDWGLDEE